MRISDWSSDVCSSDLIVARRKDDREKAARRYEFVRRQRDRMLANQKFGAVERAGAEIGVIDARKRDEVLVEQRQVGRCGRSGHGSTPVSSQRRDKKDTAPY